MMTFKIGDHVDFVEVEKPVDLTANPDSSWYVVQTEPNREMAAQANLILRKVPFYLPTLLRAGRISKAATLAGEDHPDVMRPLFPGLLFVADTVWDRKSQVIGATLGVMSRPLWRFGDQIAKLTPTAMQVIRYIEAGEREMYLRSKGRQLPAVEYKIGDDVRILLNDVMRGLGGKVSEIDERGRITVLVELMKRQVRVQTTADQISPV